MNRFPSARCASTIQSCSPFADPIADTQSQLQPALLILSAMTSQNFPLIVFVPLLVSTQQSQNDMKGRNEAGDNIRHCRDCVLCTAATQPPITFYSPCSSHDNHGKARVSMKNLILMITADRCERDTSRYAFTYVPVAPGRWHV